MRMSGVAAVPLLRVRVSCASGVANFMRMSTLVAVPFRVRVSGAGGVTSFKLADRNGGRESRESEEEPEEYSCGNTHSCKMKRVLD
ncbi:hypothetical protein C8J57DRAFT_1306922 [Mycena rebaudengoi]|nr:hypothetical protein C8J57DRAFT_1306922 [Mycena rebaudengoi]